MVSSGFLECQWIRGDEGGEHENESELIMMRSHNRVARERTVDREEKAKILDMRALLANLRRAKGQNNKQKQSRIVLVEKKVPVNKSVQVEEVSPRGAVENWQRRVAIRRWKNQSAILLNLAKKREIVAQRMDRGVLTRVFSLFRLRYLARKETECHEKLALCVSFWRRAVSAFQAWRFLFHRRLVLRQRLLGRIYVDEYGASQVRPDRVFLMLRPLREMIALIREEMQWRFIRCGSVYSPAVYDDSGDAVVVPRVFSLPQIDFSSNLEFGRDPLLDAATEYRSQRLQRRFLERWMHRHLVEMEGKVLENKHRLLEKKRWLYEMLRVHSMVNGHRQNLGLAQWKGKCLAQFRRRCWSNAVRRSKSRLIEASALFQSMWGLVLRERIQVRIRGSKNDRLQYTFFWKWACEYLKRRLDRVQSVFSVQSVVRERALSPIPVARILCDQAAQTVTADQPVVESKCIGTEPLIAIEEKSVEKEEVDNESLLLLKVFRAWMELAKENDFHLLKASGPSIRSFEEFQQSVNAVDRDFPHLSLRVTADQSDVVPQAVSLFSTLAAEWDDR